MIRSAYRPYPELTTALAGTVTWTSSDDSKVVVEPSGAYNEKATLSRKAAGDVTVTAAMKDENGKEIKKRFRLSEIRVPKTGTSL